MMSSGEEVVKNSIDVQKVDVERAEDISIKKLITKDDGSDNIHLRKFTMEPGGKMGLHSHDNAEHVQYVLKGIIKVTLGDKEYTVREGFSLFIPRKTPHSYENIGNTDAEFLCIIPSVDVQTDLKD